ncbi:MAG: outer membrane beta-barrel protein, partial [Chitinophagales bacterium]
IASFVMLMTISAYTQSSRLGIHAGANFTNISMTSPDFTTDTRVGAQAGLFYRSGTPIYGEAAVEYLVLQSHISSYEDGIFITNDDVFFNMVNVPVYVGVRLMPYDDDELFNTRIYAGPMISALLNVSDNRMQLETEEFSTINISGAAGVGFDFLPLSVDLGYNFAFTNFFDEDFNGRFHYAFINAGYKF